jgi:hypothetical protein
MARSLALVSAALDGDRHAIGQLLAIVDRSLGDALVSPDADRAGAAGSAALLVLAAQSHLAGLVPPAGAVSAWPLRAVCDALALIGHGCGLGRYVAGFCRRFVSSLMIGRIVPWVDPQLTQPRSHA